MHSEKDLRQSAIDYIQRMFQQGELSWGDRVSEVAIAEKIGISRTPVREALQIFSEMGVFKRLPRFGTVVRIPELREIDELFEVRILLEGHAVTQAVQRISDGEIKRIGDSCERLRALSAELAKSDVKQLNHDQINTLFTADRDFHIGIIEAAGNRVLLKHILDNRMLMRLLSFRIAHFEEKNVRNIYAEHHAIYEAIRARNAAKARTLLESHIAESHQGTVEDIRRQLDELAKRNNRGLGLYFSEA